MGIFCGFYRKWKIYMKLKKSKSGDTKRRILRLAKRGAKFTRNIMAAQIPTGFLGKYLDFVFQHKLASDAYEFACMDARSAIKLSLRFIAVQVAIRPRLRLIGAILAVLFTLLIATNKGVNELEAKKSEIKVNGEPILVAQVKRKAIDPQIENTVGYKESPFDFAMPVNGYISQGYRGYHRAIDIATGAVGVPIKSLGKGKVEFAGFTGDGKGNVVVVDHGEGLKSLYAHMAKINVAVGNEVDSNSVIGTVGLTGRTTGAHVHLEIIDNGIAVDPVKILPVSENVKLTKI